VQDYAVKRMARISKQGIQADHLRRGRTSTGMRGKTPDIRWKRALQLGKAAQAQR